ncbi:MAG: TrkH family potassium uptake protein [Hyphomicrobiaceae bacterium]|nr:TrkH family potassium uptake protein [Hyphomicrobiaceae bacterium]
MVGLLKASAIALAVLAALLTATIPVALATGEGASAFFFFASGVAFFAGLFRFAFQSRGEPNWRRTGLWSLIVLWVVIPIPAALPFVALTDAGWVEALFEAVSGLTTTGASALPPADTLPVPILFYRSLLQWAGGLATLFGIVLVLSPRGIGGNPQLLGRTTTAAVGTRRLSALAGIYGAVTLVCFALLIACGMEAFPALSFATSAVSTGGFMPYEGTVSDLGLPAAEWVLIVFMAIGGTSIFWHRALHSWHASGGRRHRQESLFLILLMVGVGLVSSALFVLAAGSLRVLPADDALREGLFTAVSLITSTGLEVRDSGMAILPVTAVLTLAVIGGGTLSTAGGLKLHRTGMMMRRALRELDLMIYPHSVPRAARHDEREQADMLAAAWTCFAVFVGAITAITLAVAPALPSGEAAVVSAIAALTNNGPLYLSGFEPLAEWPHYREFADSGLIALMAGMIIGRVEVVVLLAVISTAIWRR